jgi:hypothetical protein
MPRVRKDNRGGAREGKPGAAYSNRSDLTQAPAAPPAKTYGDRTRQIASQRAVPLPAAPDPGAASTPRGPGGAAMNPQELMGLVQGLPGLTDPSQRPNEPLTAGLPTGPGAGPGALAATPPQSGASGMLRRMLAEYPDPEMFALVEMADRSAGGIVG